MKWYKHLVDSGDDPDIRDAMTLFGETGYYIFFRTLEILSREFDETNPGVSTFSLQYFSSRFYKTNWRTLSKVLQFFQDRDRFHIQFSENKHFKEITIKCMKLKDLCDEYTQKLIKQKSGQTPDNVGTNSRIEEEVRNKNKKENKNKESISHSEVKPFLAFYVERFEFHFQTKPIIKWAKDGKIVKELLRVISIERLKELLDLFFTSEDDFITSSGYTIGVFSSVINRLQIGDIKQIPKVLRGLKKVWEEMEDGKEQIFLLNGKTGHGVQ